MKIALPLIALLAVAPITLAFAQNQKTDGAVTAGKTITTDVWPDGKMPGKATGKPEADMPSRNDGIRRITNISRPTLTVFSAPGKGVPAPAMIVCPGGGYGYLAYDKEGAGVAPWLNEKGITAIVLKYRAPDNRDGAFRDLQRAISLARARAAEWNIDPKRIGVIGFSSGGNLAGKAVIRFNERSYKAIDEIDRQSCRPDFAVLVYPIYMGRESEKIDSELNIVIPPVLIVHSEDDKGYYPGTKLYMEALNRIGAPCTGLIYKTGGHGYALQSKGEARAWPEAFLDWLDKNKLR
jgi:acetyl esterase/lipase